jgi:hypothetical protein
LEAVALVLVVVMADHPVLRMVPEQAAVAATDPSTAV